MGNQKLHFKVRGVAGWGASFPGATRWGKNGAKIFLQAPIGWPTGETRCQRLPTDHLNFQPMHAQRRHVNSIPTTLWRHLEHVHEEPQRVSKSIALPSPLLALSRRDRLKADLTQS